jgi:hypothetical protein
MPVRNNGGQFFELIAARHREISGLHRIADLRAFLDNRLWRWFQFRLEGDEPGTQ